MAFMNKDGQPAGLGNMRAQELGYPTSGEMNMSKGLTPPPQMRQTPYQHQQNTAPQQMDRGFLQPVQPLNEGVQTRGAQYDLTPSRVSPGVASFLRTDAVMKQSGAQRHDLMGRLEGLEKNQQQVIPGVDNTKLATLVQMAKARPQQGAIPQQFGGMPAIPTPQEQAMFAQQAEQPSQFQEDPNELPSYGTKSDHMGTAEQAAQMGYEAEPSELARARSELGGTAEEAAAKGFAQGQESETMPSLSPEEQSMADAKEIYSQALSMLEEGGAIDQGMMAMANQQIAARERRLRAELAAQGGGASMVGNPALVQQQFNAARSLMEAKGAAQRIRLAGLMQIARDTNNREMAEKVLESKNMWAFANTLAQQGFDMDEESAIAFIELAQGTITVEEFQDKMKSKEEEEEKKSEKKQPKGSKPPSRSIPETAAAPYSGDISELDDGTMYY